MQPVVRPRLSNRPAVEQPVIQPVECLHTRYSRLFNWSFNRFHNRLCRVNGICGDVYTVCRSVLVYVCVRDGSESLRVTGHRVSDFGLVGSGRVTGQCVRPGFEF